MKILKYITFLFFITFLYSCDDNLNIEPEQDLSPDVATSTPSNVQNLLNNIYGEARSSASYGGGITLVSELVGNSDEISWNGTYTQPAEYAEKAVLADNSFIEDIWMNAYEINNQANIVLASLDVFDDEEARTVVEGEAKFLRAMAYFDLVRLFSTAYIPGESNTQLGVPLVLEAILDASEVEDAPRNTVDEVYSQVINDLSEAYNMLPESNDIYATKFTARALQARVYLEMGDYENARDAANEVITSSGASLTGTIADAFNNAGNSQEDLFAWQITSQDASINAYNEYWAGIDFGGRPGNPDVSINEEHFEIYDDATDDRALFFYDTDRLVATTKWQGQFVNIPFIRLAEMYLIRAESNLRLGTEEGDSPLNDINILRNRANAETFDSVDLETVLEERQRELAFEGFALFDAKRLGRDVGEIPYDSDRLVMPIPLREMDANPALEQNNGY